MLLAHEGRRPKIHIYTFFKKLFKKYLDHLNSNYLCNQTKGRCNN